MAILRLTLPFLLTALQYAQAAPSVGGKWKLVQEGHSGVSAMQVAVVSETKAIIFDQVENNPLQTDGHSAWASEIDLPSRTVRPLHPISNTWCATGSFLSNGTFVHSAGNPFLNISQGAIGTNGLQAIRMFTPCEDGSCDLIEDQRVRLTSARWYPSSVRLDDGSVMVYGGSMDFGYINNSTENNPTYEFIPPKNIHGHNGMPIPSKFLNDTLDGNQFPNVHSLPDGRLFISANQQAMIFDWRTNTEIRLPNIPNGVRVSSPFSASAVTLPLTPANNYTPEILICGGTAGISDKLPWIEYSSQRPNSDQCARMVLSKEGIKAGWKVEHMPEGRIMLELILIPDGRVVIVNGAKTGVAGWGTVHDPVGLSNADHPGFTPIVYDPSAPAGKRFSKKDMPTSKIARMYHSTATLIPDGSIMIGGSNPNPFTNTTVPYPSEWRLEFLSPPYMSQQRPTVSGVPKVVDFGRQFTLNVNLPRNTKDVVVNLMDLGFATHGVHMDQKLVQLKATLSRDKKTIKVTAPSDGRLYSPGPGFLYVVTDKGIPSVGHRLIIGNGRSPSVDQEAITNMLANTGEADPWYEDP